MMEIYYEESAVNANAHRGEKMYSIFNIISKICLVVALVFMVAAVMVMPNCSTDGMTDENKAINATLKVLFVGSMAIGLFLFALFIYFSYLKSLCNVSYDYVFVSGELRISKVFNLNKRRLITRIDSNDVLQIGRVDSESFDRLRADPSVKEIVCTPNKETSGGKDFIYILAAQDGKKIYILECRELLVGYMMKFLKRTVLASDYTSSKQERA